MATSGELAILLVAPHNVLDDVSFATDALESAKKLKSWCEKDSNVAVLKKFTEDLVSDLVEYSPVLVLVSLY